MPKEIERKFLIDRDDFLNIKNLKQGEVYTQGYLLFNADKTIRIRTTLDKAFLTIKNKTVGITRDEYEYEIPYTDGVELLKDCAIKIEKVRYKIRIDNKLWEIDEFFGANAGLLLGEVELESEDEIITIPPWAYREVSKDYRFYNVNLAQIPYTALWLM